MLSLLAVLFYGVLALAEDENYHHKLKVGGDRIVGGHEAKITDRPYQAALTFYNGTHLSTCGGIVISSRYVLTAAHCFFPKTVAVDVRVGSIYNNKGGKLMRAKRSVKHPQYVDVAKGYDIGYIDLGPNQIPLNGRTVKAAALANTGHTMADRTKLVVSGWGYLRENGNPPEKLMEVTVEYISKQRCSTMISGLNRHMICAGFESGGKDSCQGDSGGPIVMASNSLLVGIVSFGDGCARPKKPGIYTSVAVFRSWIRSQTGV